MEFMKQQATVKGPASWFTGDVWFDVISAGIEPSRMRANLVRFSPPPQPLTGWLKAMLAITTARQVFIS